MNDLERAQCMIPGRPSLTTLAEYPPEVLAYWTRQYHAFWTGRDDPDDGDVVERGIIREERGR